MWTVNLKMPRGSMLVILETQLQMNKIIVTLEDYRAVPKINFLLSGEIYLIYLSLWGTAMRILERHGIQTSSSFLKIWVFLDLKPICYFFGIYMACFFLSRNYWSYRGVINGKAGKAAALTKFSDTLTLSQLGGGGRLCLS